MQPMSTKRLLLMAALHFAVMYLLMYSMLATLDHFHFNTNKAYMAAIMTAPMLIIEGFLMGSMYMDRRALAAIMGASALVFAAAFIFIRQQTFINDEAFLRSMIPHHSSAVLMCNQASIKDPEILDLCDQIVQAQLEEIAIMEDMLDRLNE